MLGAGVTFAGYQVEGVLGQGGMGTVYLARHPRLPRNVALKLLNREVSTDPELVRRFEREADVVAHLEHPGIVGVFDRGADDGHLWIAMQYIRGTDAASWKSADRPPATVVRLLSGTASALDYAHSRGVLHRDIKPANILIAEADDFREAHAVLTDFGIARLTDANNTKITATGTFTATLAYGSPEQLSGEDVDHRTDQYSLACTLFAMLAGQPPFASTNPGQVVMGHIAQPVPQLTGFRADLPTAINAVVERAMAKKRQERFATCGEFTAAAMAALEGRHIAADLARSAPTALNMHPNGNVVPDPPRPYMGVGPQSWHTPTAQPEPYGDDIDDPEVLFGPAPPKGTALTAGITTLAIGLVLTGTVLFFFGMTIVNWESVRTGSKLAFLALLIVFLMMLTLLWNAAGSMLLAGRKVGRVLTIICSILGTLFCFGAYLTAVIGGLGVLPSTVFFGPPGVVSALGLVCASARATGRWVSYRTAVRIDKYGR
ncbi:protein kinase domain-containing protein [Nocardia carnea]|uniref:non-specific serine/threonine protein kinase n=2 Tax=Nocardia carnea TaxID=37328 RepID=A0ABW7THJ0_9NOCA|nr:protein kinase [Nocardia carnea]